METRRPEQVARRAILIYEQSIAEAKGDMPEWLDHGSDGEKSFLGGSRAQITREFVNDLGVDFAEVRCTRKYARVDFAYVLDRAVDLACDDAFSDDELPTAYTWEDEGWTYEDCEKNDPGSIAFWHCELRIREAA